MNTKKMTQAAKNLDTFVNCMGKLTAAAGIVCVAVAVMAVLFGDRMFAQGAATLDLDFIKFHLSESAPVNAQFLKLYAAAASLGGSVVCFLVRHLCGLLRGILAGMKEGRPFEAGIAENIRKAGCSILLGGFVSEAVGIGARALLAKACSVQQLFASAAIAKTELVFTMDLTFALVAAAVFLLSYIFAYGQMLQQESDETL